MINKDEYDLEKLEFELKIVEEIHHSIDLIRYYEPYVKEYLLDYIFKLRKRINEVKEGVIGNIYPTNT